MERLKNKKGAVMTLFAILLPVLLAFTGIAVDLGRLYMEKGRLQNIADSAALAGMAELKAQNKGDGQLVTSMPVGAITVNEEELLETANTGANEYLRKNSGDIFNLENVTGKKVLKTAIYRLKNSDGKYSYFYEVILGNEYPLYFAQIIYPNDMLVRAGAVAQFDKIIDTVDISTYQEALALWGDKNSNTFTSDTSDARLKADQLALANIARFFLGKNKKFVSALLNAITSAGLSGNNKEILLGHFIKNAQGKTDFSYDNLNQNSENVHLFNWIQGDYESTTNNNSEHLNFLFSDYIINNYYINGSNDTAGLKIKMQYDQSDKVADNWTVKTVRLVIDPRSHSNGESSATSPAGLGVEVKAGETGYTLIAGTSSGIPGF